MSDHETRLRRRLASRTGLSLTLLEQEPVVNFVHRRCRQLGLPDPRAYWELLEENEEEVERLVHDIAVGETWFFRYPASYDLLIDYLRRLQQEQDYAAPLRMLSVACATGEEPYSMAIAALAAGWPSDRIRIDAVDRQERSLRVARRGIYRRKALRDSPPTCAQPWLQLTPDTVQVDARLPSMVNFQCVDVLNPAFAPPARCYHLIFCRNLLIYLNSDARERLTEKLAKWIRPEGLLFVGHAEHVGVVRSQFCRLPQPHAFVLRRATKGTSSRGADRSSTSPGIGAPILASRGTVNGSGHARTARRSCPSSPGETGSRLRGRSRCRLPCHPSFLRSNLPSIRPMPATWIRHWPHCNSWWQHKSTDPLAHELLGNVHLALQQLEAARTAFEKVLYLHPNHTESLLQLALISERQGDTHQAARYRQRTARAHRRTGVSHDTEL